jgi:hypothetical protein
VIDEAGLLPYRSSVNLPSFSAPMGFKTKPPHTFVPPLDYRTAAESAHPARARSGAGRLGRPASAPSPFTPGASSSSYRSGSVLPPSSRRTPTPLPTSLVPILNLNDISKKVCGARAPDPPPNRRRSCCRCCCAAAELACLAVAVLGATLLSLWPVLLRAALSLAALGMLLPGLAWLTRASCSSAALPPLRPLPIHQHPAPSPLRPAPAHSSTPSAAGASS